MDSRFSKWDGRWAATLMLAVYLSVLVVGHLITGAPVYKVWRALGVDALEFRFADLRSQVEAAEIYRAGGDPWLPMANDPWHRPYDYPVWWLQTAEMGLNWHTLDAFGVGQGFLFLASILFVWGRLTPGEGVLGGLFLLSPLVMFGVERGNSDLVTFTLLSLALALRRIIPLSALIISCAAALKVYPAFGLLALLGRPWRKTLPWLAASCGLLLLFFFVMRAQFERVGAAVPHLVRGSYGAVAPLLFFYKYHLHLNPPPLTFFMQFTADLVLLLVIALAFRFRPRTPLSWADLPWERELFSFRLGAGIFLGTFGLGTHFNYRIIFLGFCLPLLFKLRTQPGSIRVWATVALTLILVYAGWYWIGGPVPQLAELEQGMAWAMVATLSGILAATLAPEMEAIFHARINISSEPLPKRANNSP